MLNGLPFTKLHCHILVCLKSHNRKKGEKKRNALLEFKPETYNLQESWKKDRNAQIRNRDIWLWEQCFNHHGNITARSLQKMTILYCTHRGYRHWHEVRVHWIMCSCSCVVFSTCTLFQVVFDLPIAFWTSLEGSVIEMKPTSPVPVDTSVSLKVAS